MIRLGVCFLICLISWSKFSLPGDWLYFGDYVFRILLIAISFSVLIDSLKKLNFPKVKVWLSAFFVCWLILLAERFYGGIPSVSWFNSLLFQTVSFPYPSSTWLVAFDYLVGLFLVAVSEEMVFRGLAAKVAVDRSWSNSKLYLISSILFGLIHFPQGLVSVAEGIMWGLILMFFYLRTRSLWFVILIHYAVDLWFFGHSHWKDWITGIL